MITEPKVPLLALVLRLSKAVDLISPELAGHHEQVAYVSHCIASEMRLPLRQLNDILLAGLLHDVGALSLQERLDLLRFETGSPHRHAEMGYLLLRLFGPLTTAAEIVRCHHAPWKSGDQPPVSGEAPLGSYILHLADRVAVLANRAGNILLQLPEMCARIKAQSGALFHPDVADAFLSVAQRECFWLNTVSPTLPVLLRRIAATEPVELDMEELLSATNLFSHIIDFRSRFTATHSSGVAATAEMLAGLVGFSERECQMMRVAGHLHDLGKLAVPRELLEKQGKLTPEEVSVLRSHTYHTFHINSGMPPGAGLESIAAWAAYHHERMDGNGYPFHISGKDLPLGSRIMAVADIFTAITEDRPYRKGMAGPQAIELLQRMADNGGIDPRIVSLVKRNFDAADAARVAAQQASRLEYERFMSQCEA